eukprot:g70506.t1
MSLHVNDENKPLSDAPKMLQKSGVRTKGFDFTRRGGLQKRNSNLPVGFGVGAGKKGKHDDSYDSMMNKRRKLSATRPVEFHFATQERLGSLPVREDQFVPLAHADKLFLNGLKTADVYSKRTQTTGPTVARPPKLTASSEPRLEGSYVPLVNQVADFWKQKSAQTEKVKAKLAPTVAKAPKLTNDGQLTRGFQNEFVSAVNQLDEFWQKESVGKEPVKAKPALTVAKAPKLTNDGQLTRGFQNEHVSLVNQQKQFWQRNTFDKENGFEATWRPAAPTVVKEFNLTRNGDKKLLTSMTTEERRCAELQRKPKFKARPGPTRLLSI